MLPSTRACDVPRAAGFEGNKGELGWEGHPPNFSAAAPAVLGFDETIDWYCGQAPKRNPYDYSQAWDHAKNCVKGNVNILSLYGQRVPYNICRNLEWQVCAAQSRLPGQGSDGTIIFSRAPNQVDPSPTSNKPFGMCRGWRSPEAMRHGCAKGFATDDIYFLEVCTFYKICSNGDELFSLRQNERWRCRFDSTGFEALQAMLVKTPDWGPPGGTSPKCEDFCNEWTCDADQCEGCTHIRCKSG